VSYRDRIAQRLEWKSPEWRETIERAYRTDPRRTHSELVYVGYWDIAAQLKIDHQVGRLARVASHD
jgi:hypothetical protein